MSIIVENLSKLYGKQKALDNVSFKISTGEIVGFIGPNGAGKTTMMKIITGFIPPSSGKVIVNGYSVLENPIQLRKNIGYLPETNPLYFEMYIREYLLFVADLYKIGREKKQRINQIIEQTGLTKEINKKIGELSKGYKKRLGLAQAIIHNPDILILDEPTEGLDPNQIIEIRNLISELGKKKTIMLSTHIMQEVEAICHRVIIINNGKIVANDLAQKIAHYAPEKYQTIIVEFDKSIDIEKLNKINGVIKVFQHKAKIYLIQGTTLIDIRAEIFNFAVQHNIKVLSLQKKEKKIEEVFHELTST